MPRRSHGGFGAYRYARGSRAGESAGCGRTSPQTRVAEGKEPEEGDGSTDAREGTDGRSEAGGDGASTSFCNDPTRSAEAPPATTPGGGSREGAGEGHRYSLANYVALQTTHNCLLYKLRRIMRTLYGLGDNSEASGSTIQLLL